MSASTRSRAATALGSIALVLGLVAAMLAMLAAPATAIVAAPDLTIVSGPTHSDGNCAPAHGGWDDSPPYGIAEDWGTFDGSQASNTATATIEAGWTVDLCIKQANGFDYWTVKCDAEVDCAAEQLVGSGNGSSHLAWKNAVPPPVDYCDPADRPDGLSVAEWHAQNQFDGSTCFDYAPTQSCGALNVQLTRNDTGLAGYEFRWAYGNSVPDAFNGDGSFPASFAEDEGDGSVDVTYYLVGPEGDYFASATAPGDFPNWWNRVGKTVTVDTDCDQQPTAPQFTVEAGCDESDNPTVTVTVTSNPDDELITVSITGEEDVTITETQTFPGDAFDVLTASYGEDEKLATFRDDCGEEIVPATASFTTGTECSANLPAVTYDATVSETADDPIGDITLTVTDANGVERATRTFSATAADSIQLPTALEGETVNVSWDFDDTTLQQTLASGCVEVQGITDEQDPPASTDTETEEKPAALPATEVKGEQVASGGELPNTGAEHVILLLLAGAFLALGGSMLLMGDPRRGAAS